MSRKSGTSPASVPKKGDNAIAPATDAAPAKTGNAAPVNANGTAPAKIESAAASPGANSQNLFVRVFHNTDHACIVWGPTVPRAQFANCIGFAIRKRTKGDTDEGTVLHNFTSFDLQKQQPGTSQETTIWPVQLFTWWDYAPNSKDGSVSFESKVVPLKVPLDGFDFGSKELSPLSTLASNWEGPLNVSQDCGDGISCYFNRGIVAAEWVSRALKAKQKPSESLSASLEDAIKTPGNPLRDELGGVLKTSLLKLLDDVKANGGSIFAALYELDDPELMQRFEALGSKANLILANGAFSKEKPDESKEARDTLRNAPADEPNGKVNLFDRMVSQGHFAHNKFVVFCDAKGKPQTVWTGSTNWTMTGLCTQANNGLLLQDPDVADAFLQQWERIHEAGNDFPEALTSANSQQKQFVMGGQEVNGKKVGGSTVTVWFVPTQHQEDLQHARRLINGAQDGILFLMFEPGAFEAVPAKWTLLQTILNRHQPQPNPYLNPDLYIRGVVNQQVPSLTEDPKSMGHELDPSAATHTTTLFNSGTGSPFRTTDDVLSPQAIKVAFGPWVTQLLNQGVKIHSKMIVIDPFGEHPVVMTGSHNMGYKASTMNDDNLVIIENNVPLAQAYAANVIAVYNQYRTNAMAGKPGATDAFALKKDASWQKNHFVKPDLDDLNFWLKSSK